MAEAVRFVCSHCQHVLEAWSDGNPYYLDEAGKKQYAYHPDHERLARCVGNDSPHLCLACGAEVWVDSRAPMATCPKCGAGELADTFRLEGQRCPFCKRGTFTLDDTCHAIS